LSRQIVFRSLWRGLSSRAPVAIGEASPILADLAELFMRLIFMGTPDFAATALEALIMAGHEVAAVYTQPPRPAQRGQQLRKSPVHLLAERHGREVRTPERLRSAEDQTAFASLKADIAVVAAYGLILPQAVLDAPRFGCLNIHASLLPRWRGAAPIHRAIMAGDTQTGICIMQMEAGLDTGPVLLREATAIDDDDTTGSLHDRLAGMGGRLIVDALARLDQLSPQVQVAQGATYASKIEKSEARLDFERPADELCRLVRALNPSPGAYVERAGTRLKLLRAQASSIAAIVQPGTIMDARLSIACAKATQLQPLIVQPAGRQAMSIDDYLRGHPVVAGERLS
jgi:methionyl-tRNA formyltransferase